MIKGRVREKITVEKVLEKVTEWEIYRFYIGHDFKLGKPFPSPLREDRHPSFSIDQLNNGLHHTDWSYGEFRGDCVDLVQQMFHLTLPEALRRIDQDFGLGLYGNNVFSIRTAPVFKVPKLEEKRPSLIQFTGTQKFKQAELSYWKDYHIGADILKKENVFAVRSLFIDRQKIALSAGDLIYAYWYPDINKCKIYRPLSCKKKKEWKWRSSVPIDYVDRLSTIQGVPKTIVTKSKKDQMVLSQVFPSVCSVQNESIVALNKHTIQYLQAYGGEVYINYDNDTPGKTNSIKVTTEFGFKHINVEDKYLKDGIKDFADLAKIKGLNILKEYLTFKGLL
jgi:hypothetical protein